MAALGHRNALKRWWRRMWCWHLGWYRAPHKDRLWRLGLIAWKCDFCDKVIHRERENPPMNYYIGPAA